MNGGASAGGPHCPHCGAELPILPTGEAADVVDASAEVPGSESDAVFCPSCGRRVEGWRTGLRAALGGAAGGSALPGGDEPTRAMEPTESLLRAVALSKAEAHNAPVVGDGQSAGASMGVEPVRKRRTPLVLLVGLAALAAGALVVTSTLRNRATPVEVATEAPAAVTPSEGPIPNPSTAPSAGGKKTGKPRRINAPPIAPAPGSHPTPNGTAAAPVATKATAPKPAEKGPLPHKAAKTDSRSADVAALPSGTAAPSAELPMAANETVENEATPMTEAERRSEAAARADADSVRFVVKARLPQVHACYTRVFKESSPGGRVDVGFLVGANGKATKIHTESNTTGVAALSACLEQRIGEWDFPRPVSGTFELIYPFIFSPGT